MNEREQILSWVKVMEMYFENEQVMEMEIDHESYYEKAVDEDDDDEGASSEVGNEISGGVNGNEVLGTTELDSLPLEITENIEE